MAAEAIRVGETSATTGTGDITLDGAETGAITFNTARGLDARFEYIIRNVAGDWEAGIGSLSGTTTLVRETVRRNSLGTKAKISFTGALRIGIARMNLRLPREVSTDNQIISDHIVDGDNFANMIATREYYLYFELRKEASVDGMGIHIQVGAGSAPPTDRIHLALYETTENLYPGNRIASVVDLDPSITGLQSKSFTAIDLTPGSYFVAYWSDVAPSVRHYDNAGAGAAGLGVDPGIVKIQGFRNTNASIASMPDPAPTGMIATQTDNNPSIFLERV